MFTLFIVGSMGFYVLLVIEFFILIWLYHFVESTDTPTTGISSITIAIVIICLWIFGDFNVFTWAWSNKLLALTGTFAYFAVGFLVALMAYGFKIKRFRTKMPEMQKKYDEYINNLNDYEVRNKNYKSFKQFIGYHFSYREAKMLRLADMRNWIIYWISYYPIGLTYKIIVNGIRGIGTCLYDNLLVGVFRFFHSKVSEFEEATVKGTDIAINMRLSEMKEKKSDGNF